MLLGYACLYICARVFALTRRRGDLKAAIESDGLISKEQAIALGSINVEKLLGIERNAEESELVVTRGGDIVSYGKVVGVVSPRRGMVDFL